MKGNRWLVATALISLVLLTIALSIATRANAAELYTETSMPGESADAFVLRISRQARRAGEAHRSEVCGSVVKVGVLYVLTMRTNYDANECTLIVGPDTIATFHTHLYTGGDGFGSGDYSHAGYLVTRKGVLYQSGRGTERKVK